MVTTSSQQIPLTILTGFLGAGKTTLLNYILKSDHGLRVAVLVNDFGAINIDSQIIIDIEGETTSLANGCICCTIRDDLLDTVCSVLDREERPEYIIIEASGVSDPWAIAQTFEHPELRPFITVDSIVALIDAEYAFQHHQDYADLIVDQIAASDIAVLNKVDLVDAEQRANIYDWIHTITPRARILESTYGQVPLELLLGVGHYQKQLEVDHHRSHDHSHHHEHDEICDHDHEYDHGAMFDTWSYTSDRPFTLKSFRKATMEVPTTIFRAKGIVHLAEVPSRRIIFHLVGKRINMIVSEEWGNTPPHNQFVMIGKPDSFNTTKLQHLFDACLAAEETPPQIMSDQTWTREST